MKKISAFMTILFFISCDTKSPVNIYNSSKYTSFSEQDRIIGESIWATSCFRCHMYGSNGGTILSDKKYWDKAAEKGFESLYQSVWEGKRGEEGAMPPKGLCSSCSEEQIEKSVLYLFQHIQQIQIQDSLEQANKS